MNWEAIGAVAELLGALGVIGSLIYVAFQMKASTLASKAESKLRMTANLVSFGDMLIDDPGLNDVMLAGRRGIDTLSKEDSLRFSNLALKAC